MQTVVHVQVVNLPNVKMENQSPEIIPFHLDPGSNIVANMINVLTTEELE